MWRGLVGYRAAIRLGDIGTSRIATLAAGEVRISGTVLPAEVTLVSPLQSARCVWYRSRVSSGRDDDERSEERGVGFRVRDASGTIRVFPRDAVVEAPDAFSARAGLFGEDPPGLRLRSGGLFGPGDDTDRDAAIAALLTVHRPEPVSPLLRGRGHAGGAGPGGFDAERDRARYREARLEPGDVVTVVGTAQPFGHLADPGGADRLDRVADPMVGLDDPVVAATIAEARAAGLLVPPEEAWERRDPRLRDRAAGAPPELDPAARPLPLASLEQRAETARTSTSSRTSSSSPPRPTIRSSSRRGRRPSLGHGRWIVSSSGSGARRLRSRRRSSSRSGSRRSSAREAPFDWRNTAPIGDDGRTVTRPGSPCMSPIALAALFAGALVALLAAWLAIVTYNAVVALRERADKAWANVDVALKQRHDTLPNLVRAVRGVMAFERSVLEDVARLRSAYSDRDPIPRQAATSVATSAAVGRLLAVVERYPELRAAANVQSLQAEVARLESLIADRRELYNDAVYRYNTRIQQLPAALLVPLAGWQEREFFEADEGSTATPDLELSAT